MKDNMAAVIEVRDDGDNSFEVLIAGKEEILSDAILAVFLQQPSLAVEFLTQLIYNFRESTRVGRIFRCTPPRDHDARKILKTFARDPGLALAVLVGIFQTIADQLEKETGTAPIVEAPTLLQ